jgi:hypothetical protein
MQKRWLCWVILFTLVWMAACGTSQDVSPDAVKTENALTLDLLNVRYLTKMNMTYSAPLALTASPGFTPNLGEETLLSPSPSFSPSPTSAPCYRARVLSESPGPYTSSIAPGEHFIKTWKLLNTGSCPWPAEVQLVYVQVTRNLTADILDQMSGPDQQPIGVKVPVGGTVDVQVALIAPLQPGQYAGYWMLRNTYGGRFGEGLQGESAFSVTLSVRAQRETIPSPTATWFMRTATLPPSNTPTATEATAAEPTSEPSQLPPTESPTEATPGG